MKRMTRIGVAAAVATLLVVAGIARLADRPAPVADPPVGGYAEAPCWFDVDLDRTVVCGAFVIPENWDVDGSRTQRLSIVTFKAARGSGAAAPILFLNGGPGDRVRTRTDNEVRDWADWLKRETWTHERDFIVLAQRGTNWTDANLACAELGDPRLYAGVSEQPGAETDWRTDTKRAYEACRDGLVAAGHDLAAYSTYQGAKDVAGLRHAIGVDGWVLYGVSYGTRLALTVMRDHPRGIDAAVLDSVWPPEVGVGANDSAAFMATLTKIAEACRADAVCNGRYPDVVGAFVSSIERLRRAPVEISVPGTGGAKSLYVLYHPTLFVDTLYFAMYWWDTVKTIPKAVDGFARSDFDAFVGLARDYIDDPQYEAFAHGTATAINCNDNLAVDAAVDWDAQVAAYPFLREWIEDFNDDTFCDDWALDVARRGTAAPTVSDIPTLLLAGGLDVATPAEYARMTAARLSASHLFVFPATSHDVIDSHQCASDLVAAFLADPAPRPAPGCFDPDESVQFDDD